MEFDLEAIFLTRSFSDFQALYRIAHASRFLPADAGEVYLEEYFKHSQSVGEKVGAGLRKNVLSAITTLGNGFLDAELLSELKGDQTKCHKFYEEILKTVYRIIFLLYAEQRGCWVDLKNITSTWKSTVSPPYESEQQVMAGRMATRTTG